MAAMAPGWRVLLIGGPSAAGKSYAAREIGARHGVSVLLADDLRLAYQRLVDRRQMPRLHRFLEPETPAWSSPEAFRDALVDVGRVVSYTVGAIVEHHLVRADAGRLIIEGDAILPGIAPGDRLVRTVMILEPSAQVLRQRMLERFRTGERDSAGGPGSHAGRRMLRADVETAASGSALFSHWLEEEARACGVPTLRSAPLPTLPERALAAVTAPRRELVAVS
jgi:hypothetical protein